jgi:hypothetical protein
MRKALTALMPLVFAACGDIIGLNGYSDAVEGGVDGSADSGRDASGADVVMMDGADAMEACVPTTEDCTNGRDDDCNGLADCMDPVCKTGFTCVPAPPNGWPLTAYDQDQRAACATGFNTPTDVQEGINAPAATCGCGCTTTNPSCVVGNLSITAGGNGACNDVTAQSRPAAAGCNALNPQFTTSGDQISVTGPAPNGGSCTANPTKTLPNVTYQHQGRTCAYPGITGAGCMGGNVCAPKATASTDGGAPPACVSQGGMQACPGGFPVQHLVGSMLVDTRDCSACTCTFNAGTCTGTATFYTDNGCTQNAQNVAVDAVCHGVSDRTWRRYRYTPQTAASCTPSSVNATGTVAFGDIKTVCCTN